ncbi:MAG: hypothetical protein ACR2H1_00735, partial [Limisphaerales bacterium]
MFQKTKSFLILVSVCVAAIFCQACQTSNKTEPAVSQKEVSTNQSQLKLPALFSDNMVLQQGMNVPIWGWANDGEKITVTFRN